MQTSEEILLEVCGTNKFSFHNIEGNQRDEEDIIFAMEEYAKQQTIDFGRWLLKHVDIKTDFEGYWTYEIYEEGSPIGFFDTSEVFDYYLKQTNGINTSKG